MDLQFIGNRFDYKQLLSVSTLHGGPLIKTNTIQRYLQKPSIAMGADKRHLRQPPKVIFVKKEETVAPSETKPDVEETKPDVEEDAAIVMTVEKDEEILPEVVKEDVVVEMEKVAIPEKKISLFYQYIMNARLKKESKQQQV